MNEQNDSNKSLADKFDGLMHSFFRTELPASFEPPKVAVTQRFRIEPRPALALAIACALLLLAQIALLESATAPLLAPRESGTVRTQASRPKPVTSLPHHPTDADTTRDSQSNSKD